jgi:hypothetical protein
MVRIQLSGIFHIFNPETEPKTKVHKNSWASLGILRHNIMLRPHRLSTN